MRQLVNLFQKTATSILLFPVMLIFFGFGFYVDVSAEVNGQSQQKYNLSGSRTGN